MKALLEARGLAPRKALGQHFLIDQNLLRKLLDAAGVSAGDVVLEVGPGTGTLTEALLDRGAHVVAVELDEGLADLLAERLPARGAAAGAGGAGAVGGAGGSFTLVRGDCLSRGPRLNAQAAAALGGRRFKLVANLPYAAGTPLMMSLMIEHPECAVMAVTIQREVAQRLGAGPGGKDYGLLGVMAGALMHVEPVGTLPPECFWPRPEVTSAMLVLRRRASALTEDAGALAGFAQRLFGRRRKQLGAILGRSVAWPAGVSATQRPEELSPEAMEALRVAWGVGGAGVDARAGAV